MPANTVRIEMVTMSCPARRITMNFNIAPLSWAVGKLDDGLLKIGAGQHIPTPRVVYDDGLIRLRV